MTIRFTICASLLMLFPLALPAQSPSPGAPLPGGGPVPAPVAAAPAAPSKPAAKPQAKPVSAKPGESEAAAKELISKLPNASEAVPMIRRLLEQMGWLAWPFAVLSVITMSLIFLQLLTLHRWAVASDRFMKLADELIRQRNFDKLLELCKHKYRNQLVAHVTRRAIEFAMDNKGAGFEQVRNVAEAEGNRQSNMLMQRVSYLADIGSLAPLLGLMGTVIGLISSFYAIAQENYTGAQQIAVAKGVGQALMTTASGLAIAIPAVLFYAMFRARANTLVAELESACTHILAVLAASHNAAAAAARYEASSSRPRRTNA